MEIWNQPIDLRIAVAQERLYNELTTSDLVSETISRHLLRARLGHGGGRVAGGETPGDRDGI